MSDSSGACVKSSTLVSDKRVTFDTADCLIPELRYLGWSRFDAARLSSLEAHSHQDAYELCYIKRGTSIWWVGDRVIGVEPGDIFITWPNELHGGLHGIMQPCELYWLQFVLPADGGFLAFSEGETRRLEQRMASLPQRRAHSRQDLSPAFERILSAHLHVDQFSAAATRCSMQLLLLDVLEQFENASISDDREHHYSRRIQRAVQWMSLRYDSIPSVDEIAERVGLHASHFRTLFRQETGFSPIEYLTRLRIHAARELLIETDLSITAIALRVGFNSSQYFSTCFRKSVGKSPRDFRISAEAPRQATY